MGDLLVPREKPIHTIIDGHTFTLIEVTGWKKSKTFSIQRDGQINYIPSYYIEHYVPEIAAATTSSWDAWFKREHFLYKNAYAKAWEYFQKYLFLL